ncbi:hypothetical protein CAEBREN_15797 [Caenorhabditis brenneri]|uniref:Uncharacterized protein n=1 Tax=Caenorhabditis brenneri TaxID=135651 RepID=G0N3A9_CAEBE|nr:hypothetical protein CAEBREN_15797 [Caenorhabditis brenneri]
MADMEDAAPAQPDAALAQPDAALAQPDAAPAQLDAAPDQPDAAPDQLEAAPAQPEAAPAQLDADAAQLDDAPAQPQPDEVVQVRNNFGTKVRHFLASAFIYMVFFTASPCLLLIPPTSVAFAGIRAMYTFFDKPKTGRKSSRFLGNQLKTIPEEDSGISESSGATSSDDETVPNIPNFEFEAISNKLKLLNFSEALPPLILEYLTMFQKVPVLVTLRDVAVLTHEESTTENTIRIQYKKRKLKVMRIKPESIAEILQNSKAADGCPSMIYLFPSADFENTETLAEKLAEKDYENMEKLAENRKFVKEIKLIVAELGEKLEDLEQSDMEFLLIRQDKIHWCNSAF